MLLFFSIVVVDYLWWSYSVNNGERWWWSEVTRHCNNVSVSERERDLPDGDDCAGNLSHFWREKVKKKKKNI